MCPWRQESFMNTEWFLEYVWVGFLLLSWEEGGSSSQTLTSSHSASPHPSSPSCLLTFERREKELILNTDTHPHSGNSISNALCHQIRCIALAPVSLQSLHFSAWLFTVRGHSYRTPFPTRKLPSGWRAQASLWSLGIPRTSHSLHARVCPNSPHSGWNFGQNQSNNLNVKCTKWALAKIGSNHKACSEYVRTRWQKSLNIWRKSVSGPFGEKRTNRTYHENILLWFGNSLYFELYLGHIPYQSNIKLLIMCINNWTLTMNQARGQVFMNRDPKCVKYY